jgi:hypothetical protein
MTQTKAKTDRGCMRFLRYRSDGEPRQFPAILDHGHTPL